MSTYLLLLEAVRSEDLGFLQDFVKENYNEININDGDDDGVTAVHIAAGLEKNIMLEYLLNHGSAIDSQTQEGLTPLHIAAMWGRSQQVATLLNHKADCSIVDSNGYNAVMHAVNSQEDGSQTCIDLILSHQENRNGYSKENFEELLTELSSGLLSSPGQVSSADSNSPTFSYSTITRLASLTNVECSEYGTMHGYGSDILTECSTSDDLSTEEQKDIDEVTDDDTCIYETADEGIEEDLKKGNQNHGSLGRMEYGRANKGNIQGVKEKGIDMGSVSKFSEGLVKEDMKQAIQGMKEIHIGRRNKVENPKEARRTVEYVSRFGGGQAGEDIKETIQDMKETIGREKIVGHNLCAVDMEENKANGEMNKKNSIYAVENNRNFEENENKRYVKPRKDERKDANKNNEKKKAEKTENSDLGQFEEEKRNDVTVEKKEQHKDLFNIDNDFNNLSIINRDDNGKTTTNKHKHLNVTFNPKINQSGLPLNSTFLVDSPLQHSKQPSNFFIPIQSDKPSVSKANPSASNPQRNNCEETIVYDWRELSMQQRNETMAIIPASYKKMSCNELRQKIKNHGQIPGPITHQTKMLYVKKLWKLDHGIGKHVGKDSTPVSRYPVEIRMILTGRAEIPDFNTLEQEMVKEFCKSPRKVQWRGGTEKSSFNYLLLDPRVTLDLPQRTKKLPSTEAFRCFILSIFYVGKGKRSRPYAHLHEAIKYAKSKSNQKLDQIWDIWRDGMGVISLHLFQSAIPVEAFTREACMVEALGLSQLTNQKRGEYYGLCANLDLKKKRKLGIFLLHKAFQIFLQEGERQICQEDL